MKKEDLEVIISVLQGKEVLISEETDWYSILGFLELNKISGYFYNRIKDYEVKVAQGVERKLINILNLQKYRNEIMRSYIEQISDKLNEGKVKYAFLKGSVLSNANLRLSELAFSCMHYKNIELTELKRQKTDLFYMDGERISNDIDLLIKQEDISEITKLLKDMGFVEGYYNFENKKIIPLKRTEIISRRMNRGETAPLILKIEDSIVPFIEVDINFSLDYLPNSNKEMLDDILDNVIRYSGKIRGGIQSLSVNDFFLHLIMHQYKESVVLSMVERNKDIELYKLLDIYLFIERGYIDMNYINIKSKKYNIEKEVKLVLNEVSSIFDICNITNDYEDIKVLNPQNKDIWIWDKPIKDRMQYYNKLRFLRKEV